MPSDAQLSNKPNRAIPAGHHGAPLCKEGAERLRARERGQAWAHGCPYGGAAHYLIWIWS